MEPTEDNLRAWDDVHRARVAATSARPGLPEQIGGLLPAVAGKHVLHLMCATGEASAELASLGALVTGVDIWAEALVVARERAPGVAFVHADLHELPVHLRRRRFDLVYAGGGLLRHVHDLDAWATGVAGALRPGGSLLLWDTHPALECLDPASLRWRADYFEGFLPLDPRLGGGGRPGDRREVRLWRLGEVVSAIARSGLVVRRLEEYPTLSPVRTHDPRVPGEFALLAEKPRPAAASTPRAAAAPRRARRPRS